MMRSVKWSVILAAMISCQSAFASVESYYSPKDDIEKQWVEVIGRAKDSIKVSCFGLTNDKIYLALAKKRAEGVRVLVCEDKMQSGSKHDYRDRMKQNDIEVVVKKVQVLEHNKMIVVDNRHAIIGSWNLSNNAQKQDNSVVVMIDEPRLAKQVSDAIAWIYERDTKEQR